LNPPKSNKLRLNGLSKLEQIAAAKTISVNKAEKLLRQKSGGGYEDSVKKGAIDETSGAIDGRFVSLIPFHPDVYANGKICLDLIRRN
jgi:hypothetical protein